jgi:hypothetical protein
LNDGKAPKVAIEEKLPGEYKVDWWIPISNSN